MRTVACLVEQELGAPGNHFLAEGHEGLQQVLQVQQLRAPAGQADVVDAEGRLQRRETVELVQHDFRHRIALQLDDDPHALAVGLVADVGDALELFLAHEIGNALDHQRLVHLIRNLGDDQRLALLADFLHLDAGPHDDRAAPGESCRLDADAAEDQAARGKVRTGNDVDQVFDADARIVDDRHAGVDHFAKIMRRHVGGHADGDAA